MSVLIPQTITTANGIEEKKFSPMQELGHQVWGVGSLIAALFTWPRGAKLGDKDRKKGE